MKTEFAYQPARQIHDSVWEIRGEWKNKLARRMTIVRLGDGRLFIHSSIRLKPTDLAWLTSLGKPAFIVGPNTYHCSDAGWMAEQFPEATLFVPRAKFKVFSDQGLHPKDVNTEFPAAIVGELKCIPMQGTKMDEAAFVHIPSRTLILCDLAFNMPDIFKGLGKLFMRWNTGGQFGPTRLTKLVFAKNRKALVASYQELLQEDFDRVIVNHGDVLESGGKEKLRAGVQRIFGEA